MNNTERHAFLIYLLTACVQKAKHANEMRQYRGGGIGDAEGYHIKGCKSPISVVKLGGVEECPSLYGLKGCGLVVDRMAVPVH